MSGGQIVGGVIGAVAGYVMPGGGAMMAMRGMSLGMSIGGYLDPPKTPAVQGPRLDDLTVQTSTYRSIIPRVYGTVALTGNVFWLENNQLKEVATKKKSGGKGGSKKVVTISYAYYATFALGLCEGPIVGVRRIWIGNKLWYDAGTSNIEALRQSNISSGVFNLHIGDDTQLPDSRMQATLGVANTPAYRGLAYIVFKDLPLKDYSNTLSGTQVKVEVVKTGTIQSYVATRRAISPSGTYTNLTWHKDKFIAFVNTTPVRCLTSPDAITWTERTIPTYPYNGSIQRHGVASNGSVVVAVTSDGAFLVSSNGVTWSVVSMPRDNYFTIAWNGTYFIVFPLSGSTFWYSQDGYTWFSTTGKPTPSGWDTLKWNGQYLLATSSSKVSKSYDGLAWTTGIALPFTNGQSLTWNGSFWLLLDAGTSADVWKSYDGLSWSRIAVGVSGNIDPICWDGRHFIAGSNGNGFYRSQDGSSWEQIVSITGDAGALVYNDAVIGAVGSSVGGEATQIKRDVLTISNATLSSIIKQECIKSGLLSAGDLDTSLLSKNVRGYKIASVCAIKSSLIQLQGAFPFDVVQSGYKLKFKPRGGASVVTIPAGDLGATGGSQ